MLTRRIDAYLCRSHGPMAKRPTFLAKHTFALALGRSSRVCANHEQGLLAGQCRGVHAHVNLCARHDTYGTRRPICLRRRSM